MNAAKRVGAVAAGRLIALLLTAAIWGFSHQAQAEPVRVGVLKFGTVAWELEVIKHHGLDRKAGFELEVVPFASTLATKVALQAGALDVIVSDWFWVSRQRAAGVQHRRLGGRPKGGRWRPEIWPAERGRARRAMTPWSPGPCVPSA